MCKTGKLSRGNNLKSNGLMESLIILSYLLVLSNVTQQLLIISGVELNPGPFPLGNKPVIDIIICQKYKVMF